MKRMNTLSEARQTFGALLQWHLKRGTRPHLMSGGCTDWSQKEFAGAVRVSGVGGETSDRTVRYWCSGGALPNDLRPIELALFGAEPPDRTMDENANYRRELRRAFLVAKNGDSVTQHPSVSGALAKAPVSNPGRCFGREQEIDQAVEVLGCPAGGTVLILGNAGYGKTMLSQAVGVAENIVARFGARRWFVELERAGSAAAALAEIASTIGLERAATLQAVLAELAYNPTLLILDNLETPLQAAHQRLLTEQLLRDLVLSPDLSIIASLRSQETVGAVPWTHEIVLEPLPSDDAQAMFLSIARTIKATDPDLNFFLGKAGELAGIPLAIRLLAHRVFRHTTLSPLRREWARHGARTAKLPGGDDTRLDSLPASIAFSFRSIRLKDEGRRLFALLGQLPNGLSLEDRERLMGDGAFEAAAQLRAVGLLKDAEHGRVALLPPVRDIARQSFPPDMVEKTALVEHFLELVVTEGKKLGTNEGRGAIERLAPELANVGLAILAAVQVGGSLTQAISALEQYELALTYSGTPGSALVEDLGAACAVAGSQLGQARCLFIQGDRARLRSDNQAATAAFNEALELLDEQRDKKLVGLCQWSLAEVARMEQDYQKSINLYKRALDLYRQCDFAAGEADCLWSVADIARMRDDHITAHTLFSEAREIYAKKGLLRAEGDCIWGCAELARVREDNTAAVRLYEEALDAYARAGSASGKGDCRWGLGFVACASGNTADAKDHYAKAGALYEAANQPHGDAYCSVGFAQLALMSGDIEEARQMLGRAKAFFEQALYPSGIADCLCGLAAIEKAAGAAPAASLLYEEACKLYLQIGGCIDQAKCLENLAGLARDGQKRQAIVLLNEARELYVRADHQRGEERCTLALEGLYSA